MQHNQYRVVERVKTTFGKAGRLRFAVISLSALLIIPVGAADAHEAWLQPVHYQVSQDSTVELDVMAGENFKGHSLSFNPVRFSRLQRDNGTGAQDISGRLGDLPAIQFPPTGAGLYSIVYQTRGSEITYNSVEKFREFAEKEGVDWVIQQHKKRNLPDAGFSELFFRYCKALVGVGHSAGNDRYFGMPFELVALDNPFSATDMLTLQLLWDGQPAAGLLSVYAKTPGTAVDLNTYSIDTRGEIRIPLKANTAYLLNVVRMEPMVAKEPGQPVWKSHWASLTFATSGSG